MTSCGEQNQNCYAWDLRGDVSFAREGCIRHGSVGGAVTEQAVKRQLDRRNILNSLKAFRRGDFSVRIDNVFEGLDSEIAETFITVDVKGEILELTNTINTMVDQLNSFASEVTRVAREVGTEGKLQGRFPESRLFGLAARFAGPVCEVRFG